MSEEAKKKVTLGSILADLKAAWHGRLHEEVTPDEPEAKTSAPPAVAPEVATTTNSAPPTQTPSVEDLIAQLNASREREQAAVSQYRSDRVAALIEQNASRITPAMQPFIESQGLEMAKQGDEGLKTFESYLATLPPVAAMEQPTYYQDRVTPSENGKTAIDPERYVHLMSLTAVGRNRLKRQAALQGSYRRN